GTDANSASSEASNTISEITSSTTAQSETASSTLSFTSDVSYASGSPSDSSSALIVSSAIPSDASVSVVLAVLATTPTAVGALSQTVDTTTSISVDTVYNTVTGANGTVTTASASEKTVTVTDVVTNYVTATFSALAPFKAPAIKAVALSSGPSCAAIKTSIVYLPASQSPTLVAGGAASSKASTASSKATSQTTVRYVSQSVLKSSSSSLKKSSTSSKKTSTTSKKVSTTSKKLSSTSKKSSTPAVISLATKKISTPVKTSTISSKKTSTSSKKTIVSSAKQVSSASSSKKTTTSTKKATTSSTKKVTTTATQKATTLISLSSLVQKGATTQSIPTVSSGAYKSTSSTKSSSKSTASSVKPPGTSAASSAKASSSSCAAVAAPASTQTGIVSGCTKWYTAKSGDYCYAIASANGISTDTFMSWNPAVNAPSCDSIWVGYAYCVAASCTSGTQSSAAKSSVATLKTSAATSAQSQTSAAGTSAAGTSAAGTSAPSSTTIASTSYNMYSGNGTVAAGWPSQNSWVDFDTMFTANIPIMQQSCANNGWGANNSPTEISDIKAAIKKVSASSGVDPRFILAIVMQESNGCVRVVTTSWSVQNPGLMQDHAGTGTCNSGGVITNPCPTSEIEQMIVDGTTGTTSGDGLVQCLSQAAASDVSQYYRAARIYNGGYSGFHANDLGTGCCTLCYASDVANRLTGWSSGPSQCHLSQ
ncbi:putative muramidase, partial [Aureobasidium sp. EXF-8846]